MNDVHLLGIASQEDAFLQRRVAAADDSDDLLLEEGAITHRALRHAASLELTFTRNTQLLGLSAGGQDDKVRGVFAILGLDDLLVAAPVDGRDARRLQVDPKLDRLIGHPLGELGSSDVIKARVVLDRVGIQELPAGRPALEQDRFHPGTAGVQRGGETGGPTADDDHVVAAILLHRLRNSHVI